MLGVELLFVPGGLTGQYQPLDVGVNGPFKHRLREIHSEFVATAAPGRTPQQRRIEVSESVVRAWHAIPDDVIRNSFSRMLSPVFESFADVEVVESATSL